VAPAGSTAQVAKLMATMSLEEKVGQLMVVAFTGTSVAPEVAQMVRDYHVGGAILFQQNLEDAAQVRSLTGQLQAPARIPLLIGVDQEGGPVVRVTQGVAIFPSEMAIGATFDPQVAGAVAGETARELRELGINVNFGPVVDVNSNPKNPVIGVRSYGADPAWVSRFATAAIEGAQQAGVLAVAKHFPGHGDADVDSHLALPVIGGDMARLQQVELPPFEAAIGAGVDAVMTAHVVLPALEQDSKMPATLSPSVLGYLRNQLGYQGLIITDDLEMGAIVDDYGTAEAAKLAFQAGADLLLFRRNVAEQQRAHRLLVEAVQKGEISQERLDQSVRRILEAKARRGILNAERPPHPPTPSPLRGEGESGLALDVARRSLTLVKNDGGLLPLTLGEGASVCVIYPEPDAVNEVEIGLPTTGVAGPLSLGEAVQAVHPAARLTPVGLRAPAADVQAAVGCARGAQVVIAGSYDLNEYPRLAELLKTVLTVGKPMVVVALRLPYDLAALDGAPALMATYSNRPVSLQAAAEALFGKGPAPNGHLAVPVDPRWPIGYGLLDWSRPETESPRP
jgi:beta-N-acetylhexosaminidase